MGLMGRYPLPTPCHGVKLNKFLSPMTLITSPPGITASRISSLWWLKNLMHWLFPFSIPNLPISPSLKSTLFLASPLALHHPTHLPACHLDDHLHPVGLSAHPSPNFILKHQKYHPTNRLGSMPIPLNLLVVFKHHCTVFLLRTPTPCLWGTSALRVPFLPLEMLPFPSPAPSLPLPRK